MYFFGHEQKIQKIKLPFKAIKTGVRVYLLLNSTMPLKSHFILYLEFENIFVVLWDTPLENTLYFLFYHND